MAEQSSSRGGRGKKRRDEDNGFEQWGGYMPAKVSKLENQYKEEAGRTAGIFAGVAIFVNGYTEPSGEELKRIMLSNGGTFHHYYSRRRTTHTIAANLPHNKVRNMDTSRIVKAAWIVDSLKAGKVLDYSNYLLYTRQNSLQPKLSFSKSGDKEEIVADPLTSIQQGQNKIVKNENKPDAIVDAKSGSSSDLEDKHKNQNTRVLDSVQMEEQPGNNIKNLNVKNGSPYYNNNNNQILLDLENSDVMSKSEIPFVAIPVEHLQKNLRLYTPDDHPKGQTGTTPNFMKNESKISNTDSPGSTISECITTANVSGTSCHLPGKNSSSSALVYRTTSPSMFSSSESSTAANSNGSQDSAGSADLEVLRDTPEPDTLLHDDFDLDATLLDTVLETSKANSNQSVLDVHSLNGSSSMDVPTTGTATSFDKAVSVAERSGDRTAFKSGILVNGRNESTNEKIIERSNVSNTTNPNFLSDFYNNSRLHHLSTMGAMFKDYVVKLLKKPPDNSGKERFKQWLKEHPSEQTGESFHDKSTFSSATNMDKPVTASHVTSEKASKTSQRYIMHIDMDCFFVSVGLRNRPDLVGKPVAVTHAKGNPKSKAGADPQTEFDLYKKRLQEKSNKTSKIVDKKHKNNTLHRSSADIGTRNGGEGANNITNMKVDKRDADVGFDDWGDFDDDDDDMCALQQMLDVVDPIDNTRAKLSSENGGTQFTNVNLKYSNGNKECNPSIAFTNAAANSGDNTHNSEVSVGGSVGKFEGKIPGKTGRLSLDSSSSLSEVASCSYEARAAGVKNGMFLGAALQLCPQICTIPYDFQGYKEVSFQLYDIVASYSRHIEAVSCDELYLDVTELLQETGALAAPLLLARCLREHVTLVTRCGCSAGVGPNKLGARLATKLAKPHGHAYLSTTALGEHVRGLPVRDLPGVGGSMSHRLSSVGVSLCGQLQSWSEARLSSMFGPRTAATLYRCCRGVDDRPVNPHHVRKSVSAEVNYGIRFSTTDDIERFLKELCGEVSQRLRSIEVQGRLVTLKLKVRAKEAPLETAKYMGHGVCDNIAKSVTLPSFTDAAHVIMKEVLELVKLVKVPPSDFRGVGVQVSRLNNNGKLTGGAGDATSAITRFLVKGKKLETTEKNGDQTKDDGIKNDCADNKELAEKDLSNEKILNAASRRTETRASRSSTNMERFLQKRSTSSNEPLQAAPPSAAVTPDKTKTIDVEVLNALPADIKEQIIKEYRQQGYKIPDQSSNRNSTVSSANRTAIEPKIESTITNTASVYDCPMPGPSGLQKSFPSKPSDYSSSGTSDSQASSSRAKVAVSVSGSPVHDSDSDFRDVEDSNDVINNLSQVDDSFLSALPDDLKEEMRRDYQRQKNVFNILTSPMKTLPLVPPQTTSPSFKTSTKRTTPKKARGMQPFYSPSKGKSPRKAAAVVVSNNNRRVRRRGRPPKRNVQSSSARSLVQQQTRDASSAVAGVAAATESVQEDLLATDAVDYDDQIPHEVNRARSEELPSLCGEVGLVAVKRLIKEWVTSCSEPEAQDTSILALYYASLAQHGHLETLDILVKFLYRQIRHCNKGSGEEAWRAVYEEVVEQLQQPMVTHFAAPLKVNTFS